MERKRRGLRGVSRGVEKEESKAIVMRMKGGRRCEKIIKIKENNEELRHT